MSWVSVVTPCPLVGRRQGALYQHAGEVALKFFAGMNAAARLDFPLNEFRGVCDPRRVDRAADERFARLRGEDRPFPGIAERDARLRAPSVRVEAHGAGTAHHGEVPPPPAPFFRPASSVSGLMSMSIAGWVSRKFIVGTRL